MNTATKEVDSVIDDIIKALDLRIIGPDTAKFAIYGAVASILCDCTDALNGKNAVIEEKDEEIRKLKTSLREANYIDKSHEVKRKGRKPKSESEPKEVKVTTYTSKKCIKCGKKFTPTAGRQVYCPDCRKVQKDIANTAKELAEAI